MQNFKTNAILCSWKCWLGSYLVTDPKNYMSHVMRKLDICICENKDADQLRGNREADQRLCFRYTDIVQSLFFLYSKFQPSSHLQWLYSLVCVRPGRKPQRPVFSQRGSYFFMTWHAWFYYCMQLLYQYHYHFSGFKIKLEWLLSVCIATGGQQIVRFYLTWCELKQ